jgi:hypothetical protein
MRYSASDAELRTDGDIGRRCLHPLRDAPDARLPEDVDELLTDRAH